MCVRVASINLRLLLISPWMLAFLYGSLNLNGGLIFVKYRICLVAISLRHIILGLGTLEHAIGFLGVLRAEFRHSPFLSGVVSLTFAMTGALAWQVTIS